MTYMTLVRLSLEESKKKRRRFSTAWCDAIEAHPAPDGDWEEVLMWILPHMRAAYGNLPVPLGRMAFSPGDE